MPYLMTSAPRPPKTPGLKGRAAISNPGSRYDVLQRETIDDGWFQAEDSTAVKRVHIRRETVKQIISQNTSPDVPFERSINPYRGCEHGCIYCFARPSHAYLNLSPGLDFETKITVKHNAAQQLEQQFQAPRYQCKPIMIGANTDPYQPIERQYQLTRALLNRFNTFKHPCSITTKSALIERDIDLLSQLASQQLVHVYLTFTTLNPKLSRLLEPRVTAPQRRIQTITQLREAGIPVSVLIAPIIPVLTDHEIESLLEQVAQAGAQQAEAILLRLPREGAPLFTEWLTQHYPDKADHVLNQIRDTRAGQLNNSDYQQRNIGLGARASMIQQRFQLAKRRYQLNQALPPHNCDIFQAFPQQLSLFD